MARAAKTPIRVTAADVLNRPHHVNAGTYEQSTSRARLASPLGARCAACSPCADRRRYADGGGEPQLGKNQAERRLRVQLTPRRRGEDNSPARDRSLAEIRIQSPRRWYWMIPCSCRQNDNSQVSLGICTKSVANAIRLSAALGLHRATLPRSYSPYISVTMRRSWIASSVDNLSTLFFSRCLLIVRIWSTATSASLPAHCICNRLRH